MTARFVRTSVTSLSRSMSVISMLETRRPSQLSPSLVKSTSSALNHTESSGPKYLGEAILYFDIFLNT